MSTVMYISNKQIQVVTARGSGLSAKPLQAYTMASPEGSVINGMIMDPEALAPFIKGFFAHNKLSTKDVSLVVNSSKIAGKRIELPSMNPSKTLEFVAREFNDMARDETAPVYFYTNLQTEKGSKVNKIYAESVEAEFVKDYIDLFSAAGINLKGIYSSEGTMIRLIEQFAGKRHKTFVVQVADDNMLTNVLWVDGNFCYYSSQRCFSEPGTEEYFEECVRTLSQLTQFMKANQMDTPIENIYVAGIKGIDMDSYRSLTSGSRIDANVDWFDCGLGVKVARRFDLTSVLPALGGLMGQVKSNDMLSSYSSRKSEKKMDDFWRKSFLLIGAVAVVMILLTVWARVTEWKTMQELDIVKQYNENPATLMQLGLYDVAVAELTEGSDRYYSYANIRNAVETYPVFNEKIIEPLERCAAGYAEIEITSFDADGGSLSFTANSERVQDINKFIARIQEEDIFSSVSYSGYSLNGKDNSWNIHVTCILAESAGRELKDADTDD